MTEQHSETLSPRRRDPEARRRAIVTAAAELVVEKGPASLTHRAVAARAGVALGSTTQYFSSIDELREAALQVLADEIDAELARLEEAMAGAADPAATCAAIVHEMLVDPQQVKATLALLSAAVSEPALEALALRWSDQLVAALAERFGHDAAVAVTAYIDGLTVHAAFAPEPLSSDVIARTLRVLLALPDA